MIKRDEIDRRKVILGVNLLLMFPGHVYFVEKERDSANKSNRGKLTHFPSRLHHMQPQSL